MERFGGATVLSVALLLSLVPVAGVAVGAPDGAGDASAPTYRPTGGEASVRVDSGHLGPPDSGATGGQPTAHTPVARRDGGTGLLPASTPPRSPATRRSPLEAVRVPRAGEAGARSPSTPADTASVGRSAETDVTRVLTYDLGSEEAEVVSATAEYRLDADVRSLYVATPPGTEIVAADGFEPVDRNGWDYRWTGSTDTPRIVAHLDTDRTSDRFPRMDGVDDAPGTLFPTPRFAFAYATAGSDTAYASWEVPNRIESRIKTRGIGVTGHRLVYLGSASEYGSTSAGQTFHLVVPSMAELRADRETVFEAFDHAARNLRVGARDHRVNVFVAADSLRHGGGTVGQRDLWVHQSAPVDAADDVWVHEYVHTRQSFELGADMRWFREASAEYYAAFLAYHRDAVWFDRFQNYVATDQDAGAVLASPGNWSSASVPYTKGRRVLAALDAKIRRSSGGERSLQDVFRRMNAHAGPVNYSDFVGMVDRAAGRSTGDWLHSFVRTEATPPVPDELTAFVLVYGPVDYDADGLSNARERDVGTSSTIADTDDDGLSDGAEVDRYGTRPTEADTDGDGLDDGTEVNDFATDPALADTDDDRLDDWTEVQRYGTDPTDWDTDDDGTPDGREFAWYPTGATELGDPAGTGGAASGDDSGADRDDADGATARQPDGPPVAVGRIRETAEPTRNASTPGTAPGPVLSPVHVVLAVVAVLLVRRL